LLGVNRASAKKVNCVSARVAEEMARGAAELFGADLAVATTGYAEPSVADGVASPMAWWAIAHRRRGRVVKIFSGRVECPGERRVAVQQIVAGAVLAELAAYLRVWRTSR
jgi:nicotinamide-nucleotide amidase